jgi:hypothetical protein
MHVGMLMPIRQSLYNSVMKEERPETKRKMSRQARSRAAVDASIASGKVVLSDEVILAVRRSKEIEGKKRADIIEEFKITKDQYNIITQYATRSHLVPV